MFRPLMSLFSGFALLALLPAPAQAAPDGPSEVRIDLDDYAQHGPAFLPITDPVGPKGVGDKIVFVNYDGADMNGGCGNNPANNCSTIYTGEVLPFYGDAGMRASIIQVMREKLAAFGISVTDTRPGSGDYDMEMVGEWASGSPANVGGIAPAGDCWDNAGGQVSFTMYTGGAEGIADVIMQEIAHTWGLSHVDDKTDLLYPTTSGGLQLMQDTCSQIVSDTDLTPSSSGCSHHQEACGSSSRQNSYQELLLIFGPGQVDNTPPTVALLAPQEGETFDSGAQVDAIIALDDSQTPTLFQTRLTLTSPAIGDPVENVADWAGPAEYTFPLKGLPDGSYNLALEVEDEDGNPAPMLDVNFVVGTPSPNPPTTGGSGGTDGSDSDTATATGTGPFPTTTGGENEGGSGCACSTTGDGAPLWAVTPLLLALVRRRR